MKNNAFKIFALSTLFVFGVSLMFNTNKTPIRVDADQYLDDFDPYVYSGTYYDSVDFNATSGMNGALRQKITSISVPSGFYSYSGSGSTTLSSVLQKADEDPTNSNNMIYLYTRNSVTKNAASSWNREHVWPQSLSNNNWGEGRAGTDILHIRPTYNTTNSTRGNLPYGETDNSNPKVYNGMTWGYIGGGYFEPLDQVKGDVARTIMYLWTTYYGYQNYSSLNILSVFESYDTLLKWHTLDKPDALEGRRNDYSETSKQQNRNPFVDHPELAWLIFGDEASLSTKNECMEQYPLTGYTPDQKQLTNITLSGEPEKKEYYEGESFNPLGLTVTAVYSDGSTKIISNSNCSWTPNPLTLGTTSITCKYGNFSATYSGITVIEREGVSGSYSVVFKSGADGTNLTKDQVKNQFDSNTLVDSVSEATKVMSGSSGLRLGSSSEPGSITFVLKQEARTRIQHIEVVAQLYRSSDTATMTIKMDNTTIGNGVSVGTFSQTLGNLNCANLTISSQIRLVLNKITIEIGNDTQESSSQLSSSSETIASSVIQESSSELPSQSSEAITSSDISSVVPENSSEAEMGSVLSEESSEAPASSEEQHNKKRGCKGSVLGAISILSFSSLVGLVFVFSKKK